MADRTRIEWADASWNPIRARNLDTGTVGHHCEILTPGCEHCYAAGINRRLGSRLEYLRAGRDRVEIFLDEGPLTQPLRWRRPRRIFVGSMTDLFGEFVPDEMIDRIFAVMALCPQHKFLLLTKRAGRMRDYIATLLHNPGRVAFRADRMQRGGPHTPQWLSNAYQWPKSPPHEPLGPLENCWLGVSVEDQRPADERIPELLKTPAAVRWISAEPLLGPVDLRNLVIRRRYGSGLLDALTLDFKTHHQEVIAGPPKGHGPLDWVVAGGESGAGARPMHPSWARSLRDQCGAAGVPFFFKQWGEWEPRDQWSGHQGGGRFAPMIAVMPDGSACPHDVVPQDVGAHRLARVGKRAAGRLLDGRLWDEFPGG